MRQLDAFDDDEAEDEEEEEPNGFYGVGARKSRICAWLSASDSQDKT